jgi:CheY-like chemotaxis protein
MGATINCYYYNISVDEIIVKQDLQTKERYRHNSQFMHCEGKLHDQRVRDEGGRGDEYRPNQKSRKRILVVDDEPDTCLAYQIVLEGAGYECKSYTHSVKALQEFRPVFYDLILLDIKMPVLNGFELCKKIREIDNTTQIIFITALKQYDKLRKQSYPELGSIASIQKPVGNEELINVVNAVMTTKEAN